MPSLSEKVRARVEWVREKNLHRWMGGYARWLATSAGPRLRANWRPEAGPRHLLFAFCDHHEPLWATRDQQVGRARMAAWQQGYPALAAGFRDADGRPPRHSFFFPGEDYDPSYLESLADLARGGFGEVELHIHHDGDTVDSMRAKIGDYLEKFARHGHLSREGGRLRYAFIHGNWCLANARDDGQMCGVDAELPLLFDTGCYADFTFPAVPDEAQPPIVNQIYWPQGDLSRKRAYDTGETARVGKAYRDRILMIEGPLTFGLREGPRPVPRLEFSAVTAHDPPTPARVNRWVRQGIHVAGRPEWVFVKVHTHGAPEAQAASLLGDGGRMLHQELTTRFNDGKKWQLHYVTAREMFNIAMAAMDGKDGNPSAYRDYLLAPPPVVGRG